RTIAVERRPKRSGEGKMLRFFISIHARQVGSLALATVVTVAACAAPTGQDRGRASQGPSTQRSTPGTPARLTAAITGNPPMLNRDFATGHRRVQGLAEVGKLLNSPLSDADAHGALQPILAEAVPSVENERWHVFPDGRMETVWKIRPGVTWHDGAPFTADDLVFTSEVEQTPDLPLVIDPAWDAVDGIDVLDRQTAVVRWKRPWVDADLMFANPYPKHLLQQALEQDPGALPSHPAFGDAFVGTGPFRVREFVRDSHVTMEANEQFALGRPRLDEIEVRFIPDPNTLAANILAGEVQLTLGASVPLELAVSIKDQWNEGTLKTRPIDNVVAIWPQLQNPRPAVIGDARFRRALWQAIDRQLLVDTIQAGLAPIAYGKLPPTAPEYADTESAVVRYPYDPRAAARAIEELGYAKATDGFVRDASGVVLSVELRTGGLEVAQKALFPVRDAWQQVGVKVETVVV